VVEKYRTEWEQKLHESKTSIQGFSNDQFFSYPDSSIDKVIDVAMLDVSALQKKIRLSSICSNTLSKDVAELDCLIIDIIELRSYLEASRVHLNAISDEIK
jgi:hypothetical protein